MRESYAKKETEQHQARVGFSDWLGGALERFKDEAPKLFDGDRTVSVIHSGSLGLWRKNHIRRHQGAPCEIDERSTMALIRNAEWVAISFKKEHDFLAHASVRNVMPHSPRREIGDCSFGMTLPNLADVQGCDLRISSRIHGNNFSDDDQFADVHQSRKRYIGGPLRPTKLALRKDQETQADQKPQTKPPNDGAKPPEPAHTSGAPPAGRVVGFSGAGGVTRRELHEGILRQERF
jgi:hypothetical protein